MRIFKRHLRRLIAIILATAFAVSAVSLCFPLSASETNGTSPPLSSDSILRDYVDGDELDSAGYKARLEVFGVSTSYSIQSYTSYADNLAQGTLTLDDINERTDAKTRDMLNSDLVSQFGNGTDTMTRVAWTGHMTGTTDNDLRSRSYGWTHSVIILLGSVTNPDGTNFHTTTVRIARINTLLHELSHQLGAPDHYCYKDLGNDNKCTNTNCSHCVYGDNDPECIQSCKIRNVAIKVSMGEALEIYCSDCKSCIFSHLNNHH